MLREEKFAGALSEAHILDILSERRTIRAFIGGFSILLIVLAWTRNVNWDEFYFLSLVHEHLNGRLDRPMQTGFVHGFGWLARLPGDEMDQIFIARLVMTALFATTAYSVHRIAAHLSDRASADVAVLAFLTSGFALAHGTSFRADPIAAALLMGALAMMATTRMKAWQVAAVAVLSALALFVTIKAALFLPAFLGVLFFRTNDLRVAGRIVLAGILGLAIAKGLYSWHAAGLPSADTTPTAVHAQRALGKTVLEAGLFPRAETALLWALLSLAPISLAYLGISGARSLRRLVFAISLTLPIIISIIYYRNAFPYFFPFIVPPLMIVVALGAARLRHGPILAGLIAICIISGIWQGLKAFSEGAGLQRATIAEVHRLFPEPVAYIDQNAMIAQFPRSIPFMSTWGIEVYRKKGKPVMADYIRDTQPPFLLTNRWALYEAMTSADVTDHALALLPEDQATLRTSFVHYSGMIWLAGRAFSVNPGGTRVTLPIPGRYRLESPVSVTIDGRQVSHGNTVEVRDALVVKGPSGTNLRLIWQPDAPLNHDVLPLGWLYAGFWQI